MDLFAISPDRALHVRLVDCVLPRHHGWHYSRPFLMPSLAGYETLVSAFRSP